VVQFLPSVSPILPAYSGILPGPSAPPPVDSNVINGVPADVSIAPEPTHLLYTEIDFITNSYDWLSAENQTLLANVNYASFNNIPSMPNAYPPILFDYLHNRFPPNFTFPLDSTVGLNISAYPPQYSYLLNLKAIMYNAQAQYRLPCGAVVEHVIFNTDTGPHPIHKHTFPFWIVSSSERPNAHPLKPANFVRRDVVIIPAGGWVVMRFIADVPGVWFLHCHIDWHLAAGLASTLITCPEVLETSCTDIPQDFVKLCAAPMGM